MLVELPQNFLACNWQLPDTCGLRYSTYIPSKCSNPVRGTALGFHSNGRTQESFLLLFCYGVSCVATRNPRITRPIMHRKSRRERHRKGHRDNCTPYPNSARLPTGAEVGLSTPT